MKALSPAKTPLLIAGYLAAGFCLLVGLYFLARDSGSDLLSLAVAMLVSSAAMTLKLTGWTIVLFVPICLKILGHVFHALNTGTLTAERHTKLTRLGEMAIGAGMIGTLWAFFQTAMNYAGTAADPKTALMTILMGVGSTLVGAAIALVVQALLYYLEEH